MNYILKISFLGVALALLSGCSVGMALSGKKDPNLSVVNVGAARSSVELQLGRPVTQMTNEDGSTVATYVYDIGNEPSAGRAIAHGAMDFLTLGLWEVVGTPVEAVSGTRYQLIVTYDRFDRVIKMGSPDTAGCSKTVS